MADPEAGNKDQRQQSKNTHGLDQQGGIADARGNQQAAEETRYQPGPQQDTDGLRSQADTLEPDAPEGQKNTVAKEIGEITERQPARGMQDHESLPKSRP